MAQPKSGFLIAGLCLAGFIGLVALMRLTRPLPPEPVAPPLDAARAQTWHLKGWREVDGKKLDWELWGQTTPYFCHERLGECVRLSNNDKRDIYIPSLEGTHPLLVREVPEPKGSPLSVLLPWGLPERDAATGLPTRFQVTIGKKIGSKHRVTAEVTAQYNVPVPTALRTPLAHGDAFEIAPRNAPRKLPPGTAYVGAITLRHAVPHQDAEGNLQLTSAVLPGPPGGPNNLPMIPIASWSLTDDLGGTYQAYPQSSRSDPNELTPPQSELYFRIDPLEPGQPRPRRLSLKASTAFLWSGEAAQYLRERGQENRRVEADIWVDLPKAATALPPPYLAARVAAARFQHFYFQVHSSSYDERGKLRKLPLETRRAAAKKALYWLEKDSALTPPTTEERRRNKQRMRQELEKLLSPSLLVGR
jgi:hypothetical protein